MEPAPRCRKAVRKRRQLKPFDRRHIDALSVQQRRQGHCAPTAITAIRCPCIGQPAIRSEYFKRWLVLWRDTTCELLDEAAVTQMIEYAERIAHGLRLGMGLPEPEQAQAAPIGISIVGISH